MESLMIKVALKKAGFNARQVSVKKEQGGYELCFYVTIRDKNIDKAEVEKIVRPFLKNSFRSLSRLRKKAI